MCIFVYLSLYSLEKVIDISRASGVVGYHTRLACERSPVQFRCRPIFLLNLALKIFLRNKRKKETSLFNRVD